MSLGQDWKFGVSYPLLNRSFRYPNYKSLTILNTVTSGDTITLSSLHMSNNWRPGYFLRNYYDFVTIGPSTHTNNVGAVETLMVKNASTTANTIQFISNLTYDYFGGDPITWVGTNFPGGWDVGNEGGYFTAMPIAIGEGVRDKSAIKVSVNTTWSYPTIFRMGDYNSTLADILPLPEPGVRYYVGCYYKVATSNGAGDVILRFDNCFTSNIQLTLGTSTSWTSLSTVGIAKAITSITVPTIYFSFATNCATVTDMYLDEIWMCHAEGTSTSTLGYIGISQPDLGSIIWRTRERKSGVILDNGSMSVEKSFGFFDKKYTLRAKFSNLSNTEINNLIKLMQWQKKGNAICIETGVEDFPPWLVGIMEILVDHDNYNLDKGTVTLRFMEI